MIAILHYAFMKTLRDHSLPIFLFAPAAFVVAALLGSSIGQHRLQYPLTLSSHANARQSAAITAEVLGLGALAFASVCAFWTFRAEMATRAISSFLVANRSVNIIVALIVFSTLTAVGAWSVGVATVIALTATIPPHLALSAGAFVVMALALTSAAAMIVTLSPQPTNLVWAYSSIFVFIPWHDKVPDIRQFAIAAAMFTICATAATFLLERRCAT